MKCRVCGYEYDDSKLFCPMCGTRAEFAPTSNSDIEINWNTKDFPKPKTTVEDAPMQWTNPDASEGYVTVPGTREPSRQDTGADRKFHTIRATNEEFQKLLDKEYERLKAVQKESSDRQETPAPGLRSARNEDFAIPGLFKKNDRGRGDICTN